MRNKKIYDSIKKGEIKMYLDLGGMTLEEAIQLEPLDKKEVLRHMDFDTYKLEELEKGVYRIIDINFTGYLF